MQGKNSQRELKIQLSEKSSAAIQALLRIAASVNNDSGSEAVAEIARRTAAKEASIVHSLQAVESLPRQLAKLDANLSVIQHHLLNLADLPDQDNKPSGSA
ncbi:g211 [Coccomyxa elongata]